MTFSRLNYKQRGVIGLRNENAPCEAVRKEHRCSLLWNSGLCGGLARKRVHHAGTEFHRGCTEKVFIVRLTRGVLSGGYNPQTSISSRPRGKTVAEVRKNIWLRPHLHLCKCKYFFTFQHWPILFHLWIALFVTDSLPS